MKDRQPDIKTIAYHEAGHAIMSGLRGEPFHSVTIVPPTHEVLGAMYFRAPSPNDWRPDRPRLRLAELAGIEAQGRWWIEKQVAIHMGGPVAQVTYSGRLSRVGMSGDAEHSISRAVEMVPSGAIGAWLDYVWAVSVDLLLQRDAWMAVELVAADLLHYRTLTAEQVSGLVEEAKRCDLPGAMDRLQAARRWLPGKPCPFIGRRRRR